MHQRAVYFLPTEEIANLLDEIIGDDSVIEICAGAGLLSKALGIEVATDNKIQQRGLKYGNFIADYYKAFGQPLIRYPKWVEEIEAYSAVMKYKPHTVIGSYMTQRGKTEQESLDYGFCDFGPDLTKIQKACKRLIFIGNESIKSHCCMPIRKLPHKILRPEELITRGFPETAFIGIWEQ